jgi:hypothetical protein
MSRMLQKRLGSSRQRGFWLRCFLSSGFALACMVALTARSVDAQITVLKPLHLSRVYGYVLSETGTPLAGVQVVLASGGPPSQALDTDVRGFFDFPDTKGEYLFHVKIPGSALADRLIVVGVGLRALFHRGPIFVMESSLIARFWNSKQATTRIRSKNATQK